MKEGLFRKKNLDRISSPEQLNDYIKVSNPSVWLIISALIIMVAAFAIWAFSGNITSEVQGTGVFQGGSSGAVDTVVCYVDANKAQKVSEGMEVRLYDKSKPMEAYVNGKVVRVSHAAVKQEDIMQAFSSEYIADSILDAEYGVGVLIKVNKNSSGEYDWANGEKGDEAFIKLDGLCGADIITESVKPIDFLFSQSN